MRVQVKKGDFEFYFEDGRDLSYIAQKVLLLELMESSYKVFKGKKAKGKKKGKKAKGKKAKGKKARFEQSSYLFNGSDIEVLDEIDPFSEENWNEKDKSNNK